MARRVSGTWISRTLGRLCAGGDSTRAATAPPAAAWGRNACALCLSPRSATKSEPLSIRLVSVQTACTIGASAGIGQSAFPPTTCRIWRMLRGFMDARSRKETSNNYRPPANRRHATHVSRFHVSLPSMHVKREGWLCCRQPNSQGPGGFLDIIEMPLFGSDNLVILMAFAGQEDHIARLGVAQDSLDGRATVEFDNRLRTAFLRQPGDDFVQDRPRVLGSRIVAGDVDGVREFFGGACHSRPLGAVAVAPTPEQNPELPACQWPKGRKDVFKSVVRVGVVDQHREWLPGTHRLQPPRGSLRVAQARGDLVNRQAKHFPGQGRRGQRVLYVVPADELHVYFRAPVGSVEDEV